MCDFTIATKKLHMTVMCTTPSDIKQFPNSRLIFLQQTNFLPWLNKSVQLSVAILKQPLFFWWPKSKLHQIDLFFVF